MDGCIHRPRKLEGPCSWVSPSAFLVPFVASVASASLYTYGLPMATKKILEEEDKQGMNRNNCMHSYFLAGCPSICVSVRKTSEESPLRSSLGAPEPWSKTWTLRLWGLCLEVPRYPKFGFPFMEVYKIDNLTSMGWFGGTLFQETSKWVLWVMKSNGTRPLHGLEESHVTNWDASQEKNKVR